MTHNGEIKVVGGFEFQAFDVKVREKRVSGRKVRVCTYIGVCTSNPVNDCIRGSSFDGDVFSEVIAD